MLSLSRGEQSATIKKTCNAYWTQTRLKSLSVYKVALIEYCLTRNHLTTKAETIQLLAFWSTVSICQSKEINIRHCLTVFWIAQGQDRSWLKLKSGGIRLRFQIQKIRWETTTSDKQKVSLEGCRCSSLKNLAPDLFSNHYCRCKAISKYTH